MTIKFTTRSQDTPEEVPRRLERALIHAEAYMNVYLPDWPQGVLIDLMFLRERQQLGTTHIQRLESKSLITKGVWRIEVWQDKVDLNTIHWSILCANEKTGSLAPTYYLTRERVCPIR